MRARSPESSPSGTNVRAVGGAEVEIGIPIGRVGAGSDAEQLERRRERRRSTAVYGSMTRVAVASTSAPHTVVPYARIVVVPGPFTDW